mgnify:CR=1 FL=1
MITLRKLSELLDKSFSGDGEAVITQLGGLEDVKPGSLCYLSAKSAIDDVAVPADSLQKMQAFLTNIPKSAVIIIQEGVVQDQSRNFLFSDEPLDTHVAAAKVIYPSKKPKVRTHPTAIVGEDVFLGEDVYLGAYVVIHDGVTIGTGAQIDSGAVIMDDCEIGDNTRIYPNAVIREGTTIGARCVIHPGAIIGSDGHGYYHFKGQIKKIPQVGRVIIGDDVEVGAGTTIDRGRIGDTVIGNSCKLDNQVHVGHNVKIGEKALVAAQCAFGGSSEIGSNLILGGQCGVKDHVKVGDNVTAAARTGILGRIASKALIGGMPSRPLEQWRSMESKLNRLDSLFKRVRNLENKAD